MSETAMFSPDRRYRYMLERKVAPMFDVGRLCTFIMLNPSTADETVNDPTITRCVDFTRRWGYDVLRVVNLSPLRATDPQDMIAAGPEPADIWANNLGWIVQECRWSDKVIAAYGTHGGAEGRDAKVLAALAAEHIEISVLGLTKGGYPKHPLYVPAETTPIPWRHGSLVFDVETGFIVKGLEGEGEADGDESPDSVATLGESDSGRTQEDRDTGMESDTGTDR